MLKVSPSSLRKWQECPRKYQYSYYNEMKPKSVSDAMGFGSAFHAGLDELWASRDVKKAVKAA